jgi:hypothetical protein
MEDFRLNTTIENTLDILKACRAHYLIFNEFPTNVWDDILGKLPPFVPRHLIDHNRGQGGHARRWSRRPLGKNISLPIIMITYFASYLNALDLSILTPILCWENRYY